MIIPDETHYRDGERRLEDRKGFVLCTQCDKCPLVSENTIVHDGRWWCYYFGEWKKGNDLLEYKCEGYHMKSCDSCLYRYGCRHAGEGLYCKSYKRKGTLYRERDYVGRRQAVTSRDPEVIANEEAFVQEKYRRLTDEFL